MKRSERRAAWRKDYADNDKRLYTAYLLKIPMNLKPRLVLAAKQAGQSLRGFILTALTNAIEYYERNKPKELEK